MFFCPSIPGQKGLVGIELVVGGALLRPRKLARRCGLLTDPFIQPLTPLSLPSSHLPPTGVFDRAKPCNVAAAAALILITALSFLFFRQRREGNTASGRPVPCWNQPRGSRRGPKGWAGLGWGRRGLRCYAILPRGLQFRHPPIHAHSHPTTNREQTRHTPHSRGATRGGPLPVASPTPLVHIHLLAANQSPHTHTHKQIALLLLLPFFPLGVVWWSPPGL